MINDIVYKIVIPSYQRADLIQTHTLKLLEFLKIPKEQIYIFIANDPDEICSYKILEEKGYQIDSSGPIGLHHMRNYITKFFPEGTLLLHMDDDLQELQCLCIRDEITDLKSSKRYTLKTIDTPFFHTWIQEAFRLLEEKNGGMFGIYPVRNGYFMKDLQSCTNDLRFCVGTFWGIKNTHALHLNLEEKEDVERTLEMFTMYPHGIYRYNHITCVTRYYHTKGGMQSRNTDRKEESRKSAEYLYAKYPLLCRIYHGKKSGYTEIRFRTHVINS